MTDERIRVVIEGDAGDLKTALNESASGIRGLGRTVAGESRTHAAYNSILTQQGRNLQALGRYARYAMIGVTGLGGTAAVYAIKKGFELNESWESAAAGIATFTGSVESAERFIERLRKVSAESPLRLTDYEEAARQMMGFGIATKDVIPLLDAVNKAVVATGGGSEQMMQVALALGQIEARGHASAEELNQLVTAGVPVQKILQKELGLTGEQVANIGNEGIKSEKVLAAIATGWNREYASAYKDAQDTFKMQTAALSKDFEQILRLTTEPLFNTVRDEWLPVLEDASDDIIRIWEKPGLTPEEKFEASFRAIKRNLGPLLDDIGEEIADADLEDALLDAVEWATPKIAEAVAKGGGAAAVAFGKGFVEADFWGKALLGTLLISKLGLGGVIFQRAGGTAAGDFATGFAGGLKGVAGRAGAVGIGLLIGDQILDSVFDRIGEGSDDLDEALAHMAETSTFEKLKGQLDSLLSGDFGDFFGRLGASFAGMEIEFPEAENAQQLIEIMDEIEGSGGRVSSSLLADFERLADGIEFESEAAADAFADFRASVTRDAERTQNLLESKLALRNIRLNWSDEMKKMAGISDDELSKIERLLNTKPKQGAAALDDAMKDATRSIREAMRDGEVSSRKGLTMINELIRERLATYGIKGADAEKIIKAKNHPGDVTGLQRGGPINAGAPSGDTVPAMLERDEYVLNRNAVKAIGRRTLDEINFSIAPRRLQSGGIVALGKQLQAQGYEVGEHPAFGGVGGGHATNSYHYRGMAIDVNDDLPPYASGSGEPGSLDVLYNRLKGMDGVVELLWRVADHFDHLHVAMEEGAKANLGLAGANFKLDLPRFRGKYAMFEPGAQEMNLLAAALEQELGRRVGASTQITAGAPHASGGSYSPDALKRLWGAVNPGVGDPRLMGAIGYAESSGNPAAHGPPDGRGLWQIEWPVWGSVLGKYGNPYDAEANARMAREILQTQGLGAWVVYNTGAYSQYMQRGGIVEHLAGGGSPGRTRKSIGGLKSNKSPFPTTWKPGDIKFGREELEKSLQFRAQLEDIDVGVATLDERIDVADQLAALASSPGGTELSESERLGLVSLNQKLLEHLRVEGYIASSAMAIADRGLRKATGTTKRRLTDQREYFKDALTDTVGLTGTGGRVLDTKITLENLSSASTSEGDTATELAEIYAEQLRESRDALRLSEANFDTFSGFFSELSGSFLGAFAHGTDGRRIGRTGPAILHKDEIVHPDPTGPFVNTAPGSSHSRAGGETPQVNLYVDGNLGPLMGRVRAEVDGRAVQVVNRQLGRQSRQLTVSPGGG